MSEVREEEIYTRLGEEGFASLVHAFYSRVKTDDVIGPMYPPDDFENAELRLREFLIQRFGGPGRYSQQRGHPRLRMRHAPFPITFAARNRWIELMQAALIESQTSPEVAVVLMKYFQSTATQMMNTEG